MNFDLTTKKGVKDADSWVGSLGSTAIEVSALSTVLTTLGAAAATGVAPLAFLAYGAYKVGKFALSSDDANVKQAKAAEALIKVGKKNGVKKMKITLDQEAGLNFEAPIKGVNIRAMAGSKGKITMEVEYK